MNENKKREKDIEVTSIQSILDETLESLNKALDEVRRDPAESPEVSEDKTISVDLKSVKAAQTDKELMGDTKTIDLKDGASDSDKDIKPKQDVKKKEAAPDVIAETIKENIRKEKESEIPDVKIVPREKPKASSKNKKPSKKKEAELKFNGHKRAFCIFNTVFVTLVFLSVTAALIILKRPSGFMSSENRNYAEFPSFTLNSYFSGEYTSDINTYFTDTTPNRERLKVFANHFTDLFGFKLDNTVIQGANKSSAKRETFDEKKEITSATAVTFSTKSTEGAQSTTAVVADTTPVTDSENP